MTSNQFRKLIQKGTESYMLNNKNDLSNIPTINNDGHSYIIPMDMYKEGYWAYNISNYFKARVDDNGTPFMIL